jgi:hypothetical protein
MSAIPHLEEQRVPGTSREDSSALPEFGPSRPRSFRHSGRLFFIKMDKRSLTSSESVPLAVSISIAHYVSDDRFGGGDMASSGETAPDREGLRKELVQIVATGASSAVLKHQDFLLLSGLAHISETIRREAHGDVGLAFEIALTRACDALGRGPMREAALALLGLTPETRAQNLTERRTVAAHHLQVASADSFRKVREDRVIREVVEELCKADARLLAAGTSQQVPRPAVRALGQGEEGRTVGVQERSQSRSADSDIHDPVRRARKDFIDTVLPQLLQWFVFSVLVILLPIGVSVLAARTRNAHLDLFSSISDGELLLGSAAMTAAAVGEMVGSAFTSGPKNGSVLGGSLKVLLVGTSVFLVALAMAWFGIISDTVHSGGSPNGAFVAEGSLIFLVLATLTGLSCVIAAAMDRMHDLEPPAAAPPGKLLGAGASG